MATLGTMRVFSGLAVLLVLVSAGLGVKLQSPAEPPVCPDPIPGVALNITFYPNEDDCSKYWVCDNGNLYNGSCADGLVWNPNIDSCDWPYDNDCLYDKVKLSMLTNDVPNCPQPSAGEVLNVTFYPNEEDCTKYWECDNGNLINATCPDGLIWNDDLKSCDWDYNYDCPYDKKRRSVMPSDVPECPQPSAGEVLNVTFYPNEEDCTKYWECDNGNLINATCPDDLIWNDDLKSCDWDYNYDCPYDKKRRSVMPSDIPTCPQPSAGEVLNVTFYPNEEDCTKYWECDNGNLINATCPDDLIWNDDLKSCDWDYNYDCPYDKKRRSVMPSDVPTCPQPSAGEVLNVTFYPNEEDCTKYWECDNGNLINATCPDDLIWNDDIKSCDWVYNYDCPYDKKRHSDIPMRFQTALSHRKLKFSI